ncbi:uncharacterized protein LOC132618911 [Lycium barbarum]|uniref:uncharacterized protein LOC132618911 n=1 Tax=Lycium barbarum TaxID=112863 RepID=UPI00293E3250|nr:uncharacterized protein LOC132618911 [Lycium barbarum]
MVQKLHRYSIVIIYSYNPWHVMLCAGNWRACSNRDDVIVEISNDASRASSKLSTQSQAKELEDLRGLCVRMEYWERSLGAFEGFNLLEDKEADVVEREKHGIG